MMTYIFTRTTESSEWSPRTSYPDSHESALHKFSQILVSEYDQDDAQMALVSGALFVYFAGGAQIGGGRPQDMPQVFQYRVERVTPKLIRV